jgi:hypothetical protein
MLDTSIQYSLCIVIRKHQTGRKLFTLDFEIDVLKLFKLIWNCFPSASNTRDKVLLDASFPMQSVSIGGESVSTSV